jgi:uncharacterized membrane protein YhaH (DUF805 family)
VIVGFAEANRTVFATKFATFSGRASASEFWWPLLSLLLVYLGWVLVLFLVLDPNAGSGEPSAVAILVTVLFLVVVVAAAIPLLAVMVRRLHDTGRSGWWYWITLVPLVGGLILIVLLLLGPTPGPNEYGPGPGQSWEAGGPAWEAGRPAAPPQQPKRPGW